MLLLMHSLNARCLNCSFMHNQVESHYVLKRKVSFCELSNFLFQIFFLSCKIAIGAFPGMKGACIAGPGNLNKRCINKANLL